MKRLLNKAIVLALMAVTWVGCSQDDVIVDFDVQINTTQESESDIPVSLNLRIPDPMRVTSRGVVTEAIENITILCFDKDGKALTKLDAVLTPDQTDSESGTLTVKIPNATRVMHVFANQEHVPFTKGMSEYAEDLKNLPATEDKMVYWGRMEVPVTTSGEMKEWAKETQSIDLLRNQAKVVVVNNNKEEFTLLGYTVVNTNASGMAIPYYADEDVYPTNALEDYTPVFSVDNWKTTNYVHARTEDGTVSQTDVTHTEGSIYVYETSDNTNSPASIIIKGYNNAEPDNIKYWRVEFANAKGKLDIRRNHCYKLSIEGHILNGYATFGEALSGDPIGIKVDVAEEVTAIKNSEFSMTVENTSYVLADDKDSLNFNFTIAQLGDTPFSAADLKVDWESGQTQTVSSDEHVIYQLTETVVDGKTICTGAVKVNLKKLAAGAERQEGTIVINYAERLERKVKVIIIPQQEFELTSYNGVTNYTVDENGALVYTVSGNRADYDEKEYTIGGVPIDKLKFKLPSNFPVQLLPLNVLVSTTDFNVVNSPLIFEGAGGYGEKNDIGYKYVYPVNAVLDSDKNAIEYEIKLRYVNNELTDKVELTLEAENFKPVKLIINYTLKKAESSDSENKDDAPEEGGSEA